MPAASTVVLVALVLVACGADDRRLGGGRPGGAPQPPIEGDAVALSGAVDGELRIDDPPSCSPTTVALFGRIAGEQYALTVSAPFASFPGGQTIDLPPPPSVEAGVKLNGLRAGPWRADSSAGSGRITVGLNLQNGSFDADLIAADNSRVHAAGTWQCTTGGPIPTTATTAPTSS
ncbi:MAG TPA: hypothetical protein VKH36_01450 [Acidimicrobiia bacterium]|nr:hypothetical protein [Acidimicrobiia bacterium]